MKRPAGCDKKRPTAPTRSVAFLEFGSGAAVAPGSHCEAPAQGWCATGGYMSNYDPPPWPSFCFFFLISFASIFVTAVCRKSGMGPLPKTSRWLWLECEVGQKHASERLRKSRKIEKENRCSKVRVKKTNTETIFQFLPATNSTNLLSLLSEYLENHNSSNSMQMHF